MEAPEFVAHLGFAADRGRIYSRPGPLSRLVYFLQHFHGFFEVILEIAAHESEDIEQHRVAHGIENLISRLAVHHKLLCAEHSQMLRGVRLFDAELFDQLASRELSPLQEFHHRDAGWMGKRLKNIRLEST